MELPIKLPVGGWRDQGFTLVEVLVALVIIAVAAAGVAELVAIAVRAGQAARSMTSCTALAVQRMEQLKTLAWTFAGTDADAPRVSDTATDLSIDPSASGGHGLAPSPAGALDRNTPGYVDYLDANGRWVGTGTMPSPAAVYIRRWSVDPLAANSNDTLLLQVLVTRVTTEQRLVPATGEMRMPLAGDALLATLSTRRRP